MKESNDGVVWEQVLYKIMEFYPLYENSCTDTDVLGERLVISFMNVAARKMRTLDYGFRKVLESYIYDDEVDEIFYNTGYIFCRKCLKIDEDDHKCKENSNGKIQNCKEC